MLFGWLKSRRRRKLLTRPIDPAWEGYLHAHVRQYQGMDAQTQCRLRERMRIIVAEKHWEGCAGLVLTDEIRVAIAGNAAMLLVGVEDYYFDGLQTILVYPDTYVHPPEFQQRDGIHFGGVQVEGESWPRGPVVLSWSNILDDTSRPASRRNLVVHEFAHVVDRLNGAADGIPPWTDSHRHEQWVRVIRREQVRMARRYEAGERTLLDPYALSNPAEFFAVASECFYQQPRMLEREHVALFELLTAFYRVDPRAWMSEPRLADEAPAPTGEA